MIRHAFASALLLAAVFAAGSPAIAETPDAALVAEARAAVKGLGESLKPALVGALKTGGPVAAIETCQQAAPTIASEQSTAHGLKVARTALRVRNEGNAPDAFERKVLEDFAAKMKAGADPAALDHAEIVQVGGEKHFRYMKAIPMAAEPCMMCHGTDLKPEIKAELGKRYPHDQATGFTPGELRGAFTVTKVLK